MMFFEGLISSLFWCLNIVLVKTLLFSYPSNALAFYKAIFSSLILGFVHKNKDKIHLKDILIFFISGYFSIYLNYRFSYQGIKNATLAEVALMNALILVFTRAKLDLYSLLVTFGVIIGFNGKYNTDLFYSMICYIIGISISRLSTIDYLYKTRFSLFFGSLFFIPSIQLVNLKLMEWIYFFAISVLGYGYIMYVYFKSSDCNPYLNLHPILTYIASITLFRESIFIHQCIAFLFLFIAIILEGKRLNKIDNKHKLC